MSLTGKKSDLHSHLARKKKHTGLPSIFDHNRPAHMPGSTGPQPSTGVNTVSSSPPTSGNIGRV